MTSKEIIDDIKASIDPLIERLITSQEFPEPLKEQHRQTIETQLNGLYAALDRVSRLPEK